MEIREKLKKKKAEKKAAQFIAELKAIKFIDFINAEILLKTRAVLNDFYKTDSKPISSISNSTEASFIVNWIIESLSSLVSMNNTQLIFTFGDIEEPVWIKVQIENVKEALIEFWDHSVTKEFVFIHEPTRMIWVIFSEEYSYEIHEGKW